MPDRTPGNRRRLVAGIALAAAALAPALHRLHAASGGDVVDTVDVEVGARDVVLGTLRPAEERETFRIALPRGAKIKATVKSVGAEAPETNVDVADPFGQVLATDGGARSAKTPQVTAEESGLHVVHVCGDGVRDGDYKLTVKAKMPKRAAASGADVTPGGEDTLVFGAAAGSTATITVAAARRAPTLPTVLEITGPDAFAHAVDAPEEPGKRHVVRDLPLPATGDYTVRLRNDGAAAGAWRATVRLKPPRAAKTTIEITDDVLAGEFAGAQAVFARVIDAGGGALTPAGIDDDDLLGVSVAVPAGAVGEPTLFTVSETEGFFVDDDLHDAGTTLELGPSGIDFTEDVTVTVPFDPQSFDDPSSEVQVAVEDGVTGEVEVVTGEVDVDAGTVTFPASHFSGFQPVSPRPRPLAGGFVEVEVGGRLDDRFGGALVLGLNALVGQPGPRSGNAIARDTGRTTLVFGAEGTQASFAVVRDADREAGLALADTDLTLRLGQQDVVYQRGRSADVLVRADVAGSRILTSVLLRRVKGKTTQGALRGAWHGIVYEVAGARGTAGGVEIATTGQLVELSVAPDGRATATEADAWTTRATYPGGRATSSRNRRAPRPGSLVPNGAFARLSLDVGDAQGPPFVDLHPVVRGDVLVGVVGDVQGDLPAPQRAMGRLIILVRAGVDGGDGLLDGRSRVVALDTAFVDVPSTPFAVPVADLLRLDVEHDGAGSLRARGIVSRARHGLTGAPTVTTGPVDVTGSYRVETDLAYRETTPLGVGAVLRRRGLYVVTRFGPDGMALGFGLPARPLAQ